MIHASDPASKFDPGNRVQASVVFCAVYRPRHQVKCREPGESRVTRRAAAMSTSSTLNAPTRRGPNILATAYAVGGYALGWALLFRGGLPGQILGTLILGHSMVIAAYLIHEAAHSSVFKDAGRNLIFGECLSWLTGTPYNSVADIRDKHLRHHFDVADVVAFDPYDSMSRHPGWARFLRLFEWFYIPMAEIWMHGVMLVIPFVYPERKRARRRVITALLIRGGLFLALALWRPDVAIGYAVAYCIMLQILRFMDAFQHDYAPIKTLFTKEPSGLKGNRKYEEAHTFSNPISTRSGWPNWLVLNFGFHNAHHAKPFVPWYALKKAQEERYAEKPAPEAAFAQQLKCFHRHRCRRVFYDFGESDDFLGRIARGEALGGNSASFLTAF